MKAIQLSESFSLFSLILFILSEQKHEVDFGRFPMVQAPGLLVLRRLTRRRHPQVGADVSTP